MNRGHLGALIALLGFGSAQGNPGELPTPAMVRIEAMAIAMGAKDNESRLNRAEDIHRVTLTRPFFVGVTEISQSQWSAVMDTNPSVVIGDDLPVDNLSWADAILFCNKMSIEYGLERAYYDAGSRVAWNVDADGFRLPTEAEWEYAARSGTQTPFFFGEEITLDQVNFTGDFNYRHLNTRQKGDPSIGPKNKPVAIGSLPPNAWGLHEMHGNVAEWVWDFAAPYPGHDRVDPHGPRSGTTHILRGGGWHDNGRFVRSADRRHHQPAFAVPIEATAATPEPDGQIGGDLGFRVVRYPSTGEAMEPKALGGISIVPVPAGEFLMGSPEDEPGRAVLEPIHSVELSRSFWIGATEVTRRQWNRVMGAASVDEQGCATCPVGRVAFYEALRFCNALSKEQGLVAAYELQGSDDAPLVTWHRDASGYRLPTEAEWVAAAHGPGGAPEGSLERVDMVAERGWIAANSDGAPHPVASLAANEFGVFDVYGNVWEWVWDRYGSFSDVSVRDPVGPDFGSMRVKRGGSWATNSTVWSDPPVRNGLHPASGGSNRYMGFRVARNAD